MLLFPIGSSDHSHSSFIYQMYVKYSPQREIRSLANFCYLAERKWCHNNRRVFRIESKQAMKWENALASIGQWCAQSYHSLDMHTEKNTNGSRSTAEGESGRDN